jgi:hypothetical protein
MAKNSKKRKAVPEPRLAGTISKKPKAEDPPRDEVASTTPASALVSEAGLIGSLVYEDELETTTETLLLLAKNPNLIGLKALKPFKTAVHDYWRVAHETTNTGACLLHIWVALPVNLLQGIH